MRARRIFVAGHNGLVGSAIVRELGRRGYGNLLLRGSARARPAPAGRGRGVLRARAPRVRHPRRRQGRRHTCQRHLPGGLHPRQPADPGQRHRRGLAQRRDEALLPRLELHLPEARPAADARGRAPHRAARAHQRVVRDRQDRRHQDVPGLPPPVRFQRDLADADQPVRTRRQLRPAELPRAARADPALPRGEAPRRCRGRDLGHGHAPPRVPPRGRPRRRRGAPHADVRRRGRRERWLRRGRHDPRSRGAGGESRRLRRSCHHRPLAAGRHAPQAAGRLAPPQPRLATKHRSGAGDPANLRTGSWPTSRRSGAVHHDWTESRTEPRHESSGVRATMWLHGLQRLPPARCPRSRTLPHTKILDPDRTHRRSPRSPAALPQSAPHARRRRRVHPGGPLERARAEARPRARGPWRSAVAVCRGAAREHPDLRPARPLPRGHPLHRAPGPSWR